MQEIGIDLSGKESKKINMKIFMASSIIVKLCEDIQERCLIVPYGIRNEQWNIQDPLGGDDISLEQIRKARDEIKEKVISLLKRYQALSETIDH